MGHVIQDRLWKIYLFHIFTVVICRLCASLLSLLFVCNRSHGTTIRMLMLIFRKVLRADYMDVPLVTLLLTSNRYFPTWLKVKKDTNSIFRKISRTKTYLFA